MTNLVRHFYIKQIINPLGVIGLTIVSTAVISLAGPKNQSWSSCGYYLLNQGFSAQEHLEEAGSDGIKLGPAFKLLQSDKYSYTQKLLLWKKAVELRRANLDQFFVNYTYEFSRGDISGTAFVGHTISPTSPKSLLIILETGQIVLAQNHASIITLVVKGLGRERDIVTQLNRADSNRLTNLILKAIKLSQK